MLSPDHWQQLDRIIIDLHDRESLTELEDFILNTLPPFIGASFASWNEHGEQLYLHRIVNSSSHEEKIAPLTDALNRALPSHPLFPDYVNMDTGQVVFCDRVACTRDAADSDNFYASDFYQNVARHLHVEDQLVMHIYIERGYGILLTFQSEQLFSEEHKLLASIIRGHLIARIYTLLKEEKTRKARCQEIQQELEKFLSQREQQVLAEICLGKSNRDIADQLGLSIRTIESHARHILSQLNASSRYELIARYAHWIAPDRFRLYSQS